MNRNTIRFRIVPIVIALILLISTQSTVHAYSISTITTQSDPRIDSGPEQRVSYFDGSFEYAFYYDGSNIDWAYTSNNGAQWSSPVAAVSAVSLPTNSGFTIIGIGEQIVLAYPTSTAIKTTTGTITINIVPSISWSSPSTVDTVSGSNAGQNFYASMDLVGTSKLFIAFNVGSGGTYRGEVCGSTNMGSTWTTHNTLYTGETNPAGVALSTLSTSKAVAVFAKNGDTEFEYSLYDGTGWSASASTSGAGLAVGLKTFSFSLARGSTNCAREGYVPSNAGGNLMTMKWCYSDNPPYSAITTLDSSATNSYPSMAGVGANFDLFYVNNGIVRLLILNGNYLGWGPSIKPFGSSFTNLAFVHAEKSGYENHHVPVVWREGSSPNYNVQWDLTIVNWQSPLTDFQVTSTSNKQIEPSIVSRAGSPSIMAEGDIAFSTDLSTNRCEAFHSADGGKTWTVYGYVPQVNTNDDCSDPVLTGDSSNFFYSDVEFTTGGANYVDLLRSTDGGVTWTSAGSNPDVVGNYNSLLDKPWVTEDTQSNSPYKNSVYGCWTDSPTKLTNSINFKRYVVDGSFTTVPYDSDANRAILDTGASGVSVNGCNIAIGPNGEVYVVYAEDNSSGGGTIYMARNTHGGAPGMWDGQPGAVTKYQVGTYTKTPSSQDCTYLGNPYPCLTGYQGVGFRVDNYPSIATDQYGTIHATWMSYSGSSLLTQIEYTNANPCCTFATQTHANDDTAPRDHWDPAIIVTSSTSSGQTQAIVHIVAYDRRNDPNNVFFSPYDYHCHYTAPPATTNCVTAAEWQNTNTQVSATQNTNKDLLQIIDDYHGITTSAARETYTVWTDSRNIPGIGANDYDIYLERTLT